MSPYAEDPCLADQLPKAMPLETLNRGAWRAPPQDLRKPPENGVGHPLPHLTWQAKTPEPAELRSGWTPWATL